MRILAIQEGHGSTAGLMVDGQIVALASQEKFDYVKNSDNFPDDAIRYCLGYANISPEELDSVAITGTKSWTPPVKTDKSAAKGGILKKTPWRELDYRMGGLPTNFRNKAMESLKLRDYARDRQKVVDYVAKTYGIDRKRIHLVDHHTVHAYTPTFGFLEASERAKNQLVFTMDGEGDDLSSTVSTVRGDSIERIAASPISASLGHMYTAATIFLGMKPMEHEYKVMGLAAYAKEDYAMKLYNKHFKDALTLRDGSLEFQGKFPMYRSAVFLHDTMVGERFDNISWAVQKLAEDRITEWVQRGIEKTGIDRVCTSGGVFMNVKANMLLAYMEQIKDLFLTPSAGDESNPIGAACYSHINHLGGKAKDIKPLKKLYLGPEFSNDRIEKTLKDKDVGKRYKLAFHKDIEGVIAELVSKGKVVARFAGRCEWGARALGNRTIIGDPSKMDTFYMVNDQIKRRDFWMPFAPSMLAERMNEYVDNPLNRKAPYMILAFRASAEGKKHFKAAMHQGDQTLRPQMVEKDWNPGYYKIIKEFENITGIGGVLNTSFNLHGFPIASTPEQALHVMDNSDLEYLAMENWLISKS